MGSENNVIPFPGRFQGPEESEPSLEGLARSLAGALIADAAGPAAAVAAMRGWFALEPNRVRPALLGPGGARVRYVVRIDLDNVRPPIWRRLALASDLTLSELHEIIQIAMGWTDSHLHHFLMGPDTLDFRVVPFLTPFDLDEGETDGILESDVRLDQVIAEPGHRLFYEYDFGDSWGHTIKLQEVEPWVAGDPVAVCVTGRRACPPEDVGGIHGYQAVLAALDGHIEPDEAEWMAEKLQWLPEDFDPAAFDVEEVNEMLREGPLPPLEDWRPEILQLLARSGVSALSDFAGLVRMAVADWTELDDDQVEQATRRYRVFLRMIDPSVKLTAAGYLPPRIVEALWVELGLGEEWIGRGNREDMTLPVLTLRESATAVGLVRKAKGQLSLTRAGRTLAEDPSKLLAHIGARLPLGREYERDAGLLALLFTAAGRRWRDNLGEAADIYAALGWRSAGLPLDAVLEHAAGPTLNVLGQLAGRRVDSDTRALVAKALLRGGRSPR